MAKKKRVSSLPENSFLAKSRDDWRVWLSSHHQTSQGIWLVTFRKGRGRPRLEYSDAVEEALCFGWVDSLPRKLDDDRTMLYFAPRKKGSGWSALNKQRVERLMREGLMMPAGLAKVEAAKKDGTWSKLDEVEALVVPDDLLVELRRYEHAAKFFEAFPKSVKRGILEWILNAKRPETRHKRISETARMADVNERANQWRR